MPNSEGNTKNITNKTFDEAAKAMDQSPKDAKENARRLLEKVLASSEEKQDKNWKP